MKSKRSLTTRINSALILALVLFVCPFYAMASDLSALNIDSDVALVASIDQISYRFGRFESAGQIVQFGEAKIHGDLKKALATKKIVVVKGTPYASGAILAREIYVTNFQHVAGSSQIYIKGYVKRTRRYLDRLTIGNTNIDYTGTWAQSRNAFKANDALEVLGVFYPDQRLIVASSITYGLIDINSITGGDGNSITGGDGDSITGGDINSITGGDGDSITGGDGDSITGGDINSITGGDPS